MLAKYFPFSLVQTHLLDAANLAARSAGNRPSYPHRDLLPPRSSEKFGWDYFLATRAAITVSSASGDPASTLGVAHGVPAVASMTENVALVQHPFKHPFGMPGTYHPYMHM